MEKRNKKSITYIFWNILALLLNMLLNILTNIIKNLKKIFVKYKNTPIIEETLKKSINVKHKTEKNIKKRISNIVKDIQINANDSIEKDNKNLLNESIEITRKELGSLLTEISNNVVNIQEKEQETKKLKKNL